MKTMFTSFNFAHRLLFLLLLVGPMCALAQIGVGTTTPHPSSMMHISPGAGNNKGFILPKISSGSRVVLDSTQNIAHGLIFFDTDLQKFYYFHQSPRQWYELDHDWIRMDTAGAGAKVGKHIYAGVPGNVGIGTGAAVNPTEKLTIIGNVSVGKATPWGQDSSITVKSPAFANGGALAVDDWIGINTVTRTGSVEFDVKGQAYISSTLTVGGSETVAGDVTANKFHGLGIMPVGSVIMWSGTINIATNFNIDGTGVTGTEYEGWQMCNGFGTAPDLRGRFIVGQVDHATQNTQSQTAGGYTNTEYNSNDYDESGAKDGGEREHVLTIGEMPSHDHTGQTGTDGDHDHGYDDRYRTGNWDVLEDASSSLTEDLGSSQGDHGRTTSSAGDHEHTIPNEGGGNAHENRPPYYVLAFIIRKF